MNKNNNNNEVRDVIYYIVTNCDGGFQFSSSDIRIGFEYITHVERDWILRGRIFSAVRQL